MSSPASSTLIDLRFALERECGRGGMGTVWRAWDLEHDTWVALKVLHQPGGDQLERFLRESRLLAELSHPGIVGYVAHGTTPERTPYLVMEWLEGETLAQRLAREPLAPAASLELARAVLRALAAAHARGVVHRDVKPSNLFLRGGRAADVVLLDLGLARVLSDSDRLTRSGSVLGTPAYMAPEQAQGKLEILPSSDVYSVGCLLFECLTGAPPFVAAQVYALLAKVLFEPAPRLASVRPDLPASLDAVLAAMLEKEPRRRVADAAGALALLADVSSLEGLPAPGRPGVPLAPSGAEQELVSVILVSSPGADAPVADASTLVPALDDAGSDPTGVELAVFGAEHRRLVDGSRVVLLSQRGGAATDLAARAARCALRLRERLTGSTLVVATGRGVRQEGLCLGEAVDRAGSMLRVMLDGSAEIWLDDVTAGLLDARFRVTPRTSGVLVFELRAEEPWVDAARPLLGRPTACVGRERELSMLELTLGACIEDGAARALLVTGPPGIGKSRLRHEFLRTMTQQKPLTVLLGAGDPLRRSGARGLLGGAIARWCGLSDDAPLAESHATLAARVGRRLSADRELTTTFIAELCGVAPEEPSPELRAARQNPTIMADRIAAAWLSLLRAEAAAEPVLIVLDDLQWADAAAVSLVGAALRELDGLPLMVLALGRPEVTEVFPELWAPRLTTLPLPALPRTATRRLIRQVLGDAVGDDTVQRIAHQAGGNALYLEELIRAADAGRERAPETVLAMLVARIGQLPAAERRVLRTASVFGEQFAVGGVRAALDAEDSADLDATLRALREHEIIERQADGAGRLRFRHALMCDAAYSLLAPEEATVLHSRAASYLEQCGEEPAVVAAHAERGGDRARAIANYQRAAQRAYRENDLAGVVALVERAMACGARGEARGVLLNIKAPALFYQHEFAAGWEASREALELLPPGHPKRVSSLAASTFAATQLGKVADVHMQELLGASPEPGALGEYVSALGYAGIAHVVLANRPLAARVIDRLRELEPQFGEDSFSHGHLHYWHMRYLEMLGDDTHAMWLSAQRAVEYNRRAGNRRMLAVSLASQGECAWRLCSMDEGERIMREAVALARDVAEPISYSFVLHYLAQLLAERGSVEAAAEADVLAQLATELAGDGQLYHALALCARSAASLVRDDSALALAHAREARRIVGALRLRAFDPRVDIALIRAQLAHGDATSAAEVADDSARLLGEIGSLGVSELPLRLAMVRAYLAAGRRAEAERGTGVALAVLRQRASGIADGALRERYLTQLSEHVALRALGRELDASPF